MTTGEKWTARTTGIITQIVDGSLLVYDTSTDEVHCLDAAAAAVYEAAADATLPDIADKCELDTGVVADVLLRLSELGLVEAQGPHPDRRGMLKLVAAGTAVGILSLAAPSPAAAASEITTEETTMENPF